MASIAFLFWSVEIRKFGVWSSEPAQVRGSGGQGQKKFGVARDLTAFASLGVSDVKSVRMCTTGIDLKYVGRGVEPTSRATYQAIKSHMGTETNF
jgi:hypothetical protein